MNKKMITILMTFLWGISAMAVSLKPWKKLYGIDLGTSNSIVVVNEEGKVKILSNTPSAVAYYRDTGNVICIGEQAREKIGKCPEEIVAVRPMKDGVIYSLKSTKALIEGMLKAANISLQSYTTNKCLVIGIPCAVKAGDRVAIEKCVRQLGASDVLLVKEPIAAAIQEGLNVGGDEAHMVIDIGGGTTDIIVIAQYGALSQAAITTAGDAMDKAIVGYVRDKFHLSIDEETAQQVKVTIGAVHINDEDQNRKMDISGMDLLQQKPRKITITTADMIEALRPHAEAILDAAHGVVRKLPERAAGDIARNGILLVGGGALVPGMKELVEERFGLPVTVPNEPLLSVAQGIGKILGDFDSYKRVISNAADDF